MADYDHKYLLNRHEVEWHAWISNELNVIFYVLPKEIIEIIRSMIYVKRKYVFQINVYHSLSDYDDDESIWSMQSEDDYEQDLFDRYEEHRQLHEMLFNEDQIERSNEDLYEHYYERKKCKRLKSKSKSNRIKRFNRLPSNHLKYGQCLDVDFVLDRPLKRRL
jgi:hypothetical protein